MQIIWHGQSCFQINVSQGKNGGTSIVIDPFGEDLGLRVPKLEADILLVTHNHPDHNNIKSVNSIGHQGENQPGMLLVNGPGEYERQDIFIQGISSFHDNNKGKDRGRNTCYTIDAEGMKLCHLGDLGQNELTEEQVDEIGEIDILMIPVGGGSTIDAELASKIIGQIEPKIVIPMHYDIPKLKLKFDDVEKFLKVMGKKGIEPQAKLSIKERDLPAEETEVVVLKA
jgi:L-ascorbate metabolism protein UlaG (beta-lactamase superfamily)